MEFWNYINFTHICVISRLFGARRAMKIAFLLFFVCNVFIPALAKICCRLTFFQRFIIIEEILDISFLISDSYRVLKIANFRLILVIKMRSLLSVIPVGHVYLRKT